MIPWLAVLGLLGLAGFVALLRRAHARDGLQGLLAGSGVYGLALAGGLALTLLSGAYAAGLDGIVGGLRFDPQSVALGGLIAGLFFPAGQLAVIALSRRVSARPRIHGGAALAPVLAAALLLAGHASVESLPEHRFRQLIGIPPPASVRNIHFDRFTSGFYARLELTCDIDPSDVDAVLARRRADLEITTDVTRTRIVALSAFD